MFCTGLIFEKYDSYFQIIYVFTENSYNRNYFLIKLKSRSSLLSYDLLIFIAMVAFTAASDTYVIGRSIFIINVIWVMFV